MAKPEPGTIFDGLQEYVAACQEIDDYRIIEDVDWNEELGAKLSKSSCQCRRGLFSRKAQRLLPKDWAGIKTLVHLHDCHARLRVTGENGRGHR